MYDLKSQREPSDLSRVELVLEVGGDLKIAGKTEVQTVPMSVVANLTYDERLVARGKLPETPWRAFRYYHDARAVIKFEKGGQKPSLREDRRLLGVEVVNGTTTLFSPAEPLTREELDLIDIPGSSLILDDLLPEQPVSLGSSWKHADRLLAALVGIEAVSFADVQSVLGEVKDGVAHMAMAGTIGGAIGGVATEIEVKAKYNFDLELKRITWFALLVKEKRSAGHVGPGLDVVAKIILKIAPLPQSDQLSAETIAGLPQVADAEQRRLEYQSPAGSYGFRYDRRWFVTSDEPHLAVLRMVDRGELVAQCNVSPLKNSPPEKPVALEAFQHDVQQALGKNFGQFVGASQFTGENGYRTLRVVADGKVSELPIRWIYYLIADEQGRRVSLTFTLEAELVERFGEADRMLVQTIRLLEPAAKTARKPAGSARSNSAPKTIGALKSIRKR